MAKVTIRLGLMATNGRTHNLKSSIEERNQRVFLLCPRCEACGVSSRSVCAMGCCDDVFEPSEITKRGRIEDGQLIVVEADAIREAKLEVSTPPGDLTLAVHPAEDFEVHCTEQGGAYVFVPDKGDPFYTLLLEKANDKDFALVGMLTLSQNGVSRMYRLHNVVDRLVLRETLMPSQTAMIGAIPGSRTTPKERDMFNRLVDIMVEDFDENLYTNERLAAVRELLDKAAKAGAAPSEPAKKGRATKKVPDVTDLEAQLEAALAAQQKRKAS